MHSQKALSLITFVRQSPIKSLMQKAYNIAGIKNPVRDEILVEINSLSSKIPSGMTRGIFVFTFHP
jgi:hypothetical protein